MRHDSRRMIVGAGHEKTRTQDSVGRLGRLIVSARAHRPNDVISLDNVMTELGVSRPMAREVLQVLCQKRLVRLQPRVGATVLGVDEWDVFDPDVIRWRLEIAPRFQMRSLTEMRQAIEPRAASLAAQRASPDVCRKLVSLSQELKDLGMDERFQQDTDSGKDHRGRYLAVDVQFHQTLLEGSGNEMFFALADPVTKALTYRIERDWAGTPGHRGATSSMTGTILPFPASPTEMALWLHCGLASAVEQGHPTAAEAFSWAILAEINTGGLGDPVLRYALRHALKLLNPRGFAGDDWTRFEEVMLAVAADRERLDATTPPEQTIAG